MKDIKHIKPDYILSPGSCPRGGALGVPRGQKKFEQGHVAYQIDGDDEQNRSESFLFTSCWCVY